MIQSSYRNELIDLDYTTLNLYEVELYAIKGNVSLKYNDIKQLNNFLIYILDQMHILRERHEG